MRHRPPVVIGALVASATAASAQSLPAPSYSPITVESDSSVVVDGVRYDDMSSFHRSPAFRTSGRRCATPAPSLVAAVAPSDCSLQSTTIAPEYEPGAGPAYEIPVVFHIISDSDGTGDLPDELVRSQIEILNEDFNALADSPGAAGTEARIRFALAAYDPEGNPTTGIVRITDDSYFSDRGDLKGDLSWDTTRYLNIYTNTASGALGYATFPQESAGSPRDGVVLLWSSVGRDAPDGGDFNQGRTATHEVGHYLGLFHTFQGGCGNTDGYTSGDLIADTVAEARPEYGCSESPSSCGTGDNPIHNYMDYTDDACMDHFTAEQVNRMRCSISHYRADLINMLPATSFEHADDIKTIAFTDTSSDGDGEIVSWEWDFGDGTTSTEQHPTHTYAEFGLYPVTLLVTDDRGSRASVTEEVAANILPEASFRADGDGLEVRFTDTTTDANGEIVAWQWDFGDGTTSTEKNPVHVYAAAGDYQVTLVVTDDLTGTASATDEIGVGQGCGCATSGGRLPWGEAILFGFALLIAARRRARA